MRRYLAPAALCCFLFISLVHPLTARNTPWPDDPTTGLKEQPWGGDNNGGGQNEDNPITIVQPKPRSVWIKLAVYFYMKYGITETMRPDRTTPSTPNAPAVGGNAKEQQ